MKIREELILKALAGEETKVELAAKYGVSRKTLYKWLDRYKERGLAGLVDESRRPRSSPMLTSPELALAAMQLRKAHPSWGPKKVVAVLARQYPGESIPSVSTTSRILRQAGFRRGCTAGRRAASRRPRGSSRPLSRTTSGRWTSRAGGARSTVPAAIR